MIGIMEKKDRAEHIFARIRGGEDIMRRRRYITMWLISGLLCLAFSFSAWAEHNNTSAIIMNYMGKLRLEVLDRETGQPIPEAAVELYIAGLDRYVLFGLTDSSGVYELDAAYNTNAPVTNDEQFSEEDGDYMFDGTLVYLDDNNIQYRVHRADWHPDPYTGSKTLEGGTMPETVTVYLDREKAEDKLLSIKEPLLPLSSFGGTGSGFLSLKGMKDAIHYWACGLLVFLLAGGAICKMTNSDYRLRTDIKSKGGRVG